MITFYKDITYARYFVIHTNISLKRLYSININCVRMMTATIVRQNNSYEDESKIYILQHLKFA